MENVNFCAKDFSRETNNILEIGRFYNDKA